MGRHAAPFELTDLEVSTRVLAARPPQQHVSRPPVSGQPTAGALKLERTRSCWVQPDDDGPADEVGVLLGY